MLRSLLSLNCFPLPILIVVVSVFPQSAEALDRDPETISYRMHVAPLLLKYCVGCHNAADAEHGLSLQAAADIRRGSQSGPVLDGERPDQSLLLKVLLSTGDERMPPTDEPQPSAEELQLLRRWITSGAAFDGSAEDLMPDVPRIEVTASTLRQPVHSLALSTDGELLAVGRYRSVAILKQDDLSDVRELRVDEGKVTDLLFLPDGRLLLATGIPGVSGRARLTDLSDVQADRQFDGHVDQLFAVGQSGSGMVATAGYDRRIVLHNMDTGAIARTIIGHNGAIFDLAFSPDGRLLASASADGTIKIWSVDSGARLDTMSQPLAEQYAVVFSPDGQFVFAAGADNRIRQWRLLSRTTPQINPLLEARFAHEGAIHRLVISQDGSHLASAAEDGTVKIWDSATLMEIDGHQLEADLVTSIIFSHVKPELLAGTSTGKLLRLPLPVKSDQSTEVPAPVASRPAAAAVGKPVEINEQEPNDQPATAQEVPFPVTVSGVIHSDAADSPQDVDLYRFQALAGQRILLEVRASRDGSPLDSRIEVLDHLGQPILQTQLQAVRDSYFTFRGKDSDTSDDFRLFNWQEMELNEYLYANGEVVRLWLYPRGPDSGFKVYPGFGNRFTWFGTTPSAHALQSPAFIVVPHAPGQSIISNGLPVFPVYYENDDDPLREWGSDSRLMFHVPADGDYLVRVSDARGFSGPEFRYQLTLRDPVPDFHVTMGSDKMSLHRGTGREIALTARRIDGYDGPIDLIVEGLPPGFSSSCPTEIQADQLQAFVTIGATESAVQPDEEAVKQIRVIARAMIDGREVIHEVGRLNELKLSTDSPKIQVTIHSPEQILSGTDEQTSELTVYAGETMRAFVRVTRHDFDGHVEFGKEDSGRNLPHGVFVDNIGLNGLMILQGQHQREFFITAARSVPETSRTFFLKTNVDGITSMPVTLHVRHRDSSAAAVVERN